MSNIPTITIDFSSIIESYETSLVNQLRNFKLEESIFETWVPDPDPAKSIINLLDSVIESRREIILEIHVKNGIFSDDGMVRLRQSINKKLDVKEVKSSHSLSIIVTGFGKIKLADYVAGKNEIDHKTYGEFSNKKNSTLNYQQKRKSTKAVTVASSNPNNVSYRLLSLENYKYCGTLEAVKGLNLITGRNLNIELHLLIDPTRHIIRQAAYFGDVPDELAPILELFCELIEYLPILEASDHGVIKLEHKLRQFAGSDSVPGIVIPTFVDKKWSEVQALIRDAMRNYRVSTGYLETRNDYDQGVTKQWSENSDEIRFRLIENSLENGLKCIGVSPNGVKLIRLEYNVRVLVQFVGELADPSNDKQKLLLYLEKFITEDVEPKLEIYLEPIKDQSKLRRLAE